MKIFLSKRSSCARKSRWIIRFVKYTRITFLTVRAELKGHGPSKCAATTSVLLVLRKMHGLVQRTIKCTNTRNFMASILKFDSTLYNRIYSFNSGNEFILITLNYRCFRSFEHLSSFGRSFRSVSPSFQSSSLPYSKAKNMVTSDFTPNLISGPISHAKSRLSPEWPRFRGLR